MLKRYGARDMMLESASLLAEKYPEESRTWDLDDPFTIVALVYDLWTPRRVSFIDDAKVEIARAVQMYAKQGTLPDWFQDSLAYNRSDLHLGYKFLRAPRLDIYTSDVAH